jgi:hypothetical protein
MRDEMPQSQFYRTRNRTEIFYLIHTLLFQLLTSAMEWFVLLVFILGGVAD